MKLRNTILALSLITSYTSQSLSNDIYSIEDSNVITDLKILYGGDNYKSFDINSLLFDDEDRSQDFKFFLMKPANTTLYMYMLFSSDTIPYISSSFSSFDISLTSSDGSMTSDSYSYRVINTYGSTYKFAKLAIDDILDDNTKEIYIDNFTYKDNIGEIEVEPGRYQQGYITNHFKVEDRLVIDGDDDFIYHYSKNDYVKIIDGQVNTLLIKNKADYNLFGNKDLTYVESSYYFFSTDRAIDELLAIEYDYQLLTYSVHMENIYSDTSLDSQKMYLSLHDDFDSTTAIKMSRQDLSLVTYQNNIIEDGKLEGTTTSHWFLWFNKDHPYTLSNIVNCSNLSSLNTDEDKPFKTFVKNIQDKREEENKDPYQWAFRVDCSERSANYIINATNPIHTIKSDTTCHEVIQSMITWLKFKTDNIEFSLSALDTPKDTTQVYIDQTEYPTLIGMIIGKTKDVLSTIWKIVKILLLALGIALLIFVLYKLISLIVDAVKVNKMEAVPNCSKSKRKKKKRKR